MRRHLPLAVLAVVLGAALLVSVGAVTGIDDTGEPTDRPFPNGEPNLTVRPGDGPNGEYVTLGSDGNLSVDVSDTGVNVNARTAVNDLLTVENTGTDATVDVWITHDGGRAVTLVRNETGAPLPDTPPGAELGPGETLTVDMRVDTRDAAAGDRLLTSITINDRIDRATPTPTPKRPGATPTPTTGPGGGGEAGAGDPGGAATPTDDETPTGTSTPAPTASESGAGATGSGSTGTGTGGNATAADVTVVGDDGTPIDATVTPLSASELDAIDATGEVTGPRAVIDAAGNPNGSGERVITLVDERVGLSGGRSTVASVGTAEPIRVTGAVDIDVPESRRNRPATVRLRIDRTDLGDASVENTSIGHRTATGWQLLDTRIVERDAETALLEARTFGFSPFAAFVEPNVEYTWGFPGGAQRDGRRVSYVFEEPGRYDVNLTITDALGQRNSTTRQVIANDVPEIRAEVVGRDGTTGNVTLRAVVNDTVGNTTVTWTFPDGGQVTGQEVSYDLPNGDHRVEVRVVDEYGASATAGRTIGVGPASVLDVRIEFTNLRGMGAQIGLSLLGVVGLRTIYRRLSLSPRALLAAFTPGPEVVELDEPFADPSNGRVGLGRLRVIDRRGDLDTVTVTLLDGDDDVVVRKRIEPDDGGEYVVTPETAVLPPDVELDPTGSYRFRVEATDGRGRSDRRDSVRFRIGERAGSAGDEGLLTDADRSHTQN